MSEAEETAALGRLSIQVRDLKELLLRYQSALTGRSVAELRAELPSQRAKAGKVHG